MRDKQFSARVEARVRAAVCGVSGVRVTMYRSITKSGRTEVDLGITGWSPSLHAHRMEWKTGHGHEHPSIVGRMPKTSDEAAEEVVEGIAIEMANQRRRLEEGLRLGHAMPLCCNSPLETHVGHIRIDLGLARIISDDPRGVTALVSDSLCTIHRDYSGTGRQEFLHNDPDEVEGTIWRSLRSLGGGVTYDGRTLSLRDVLLPETAIAQCPGRALGDVVEAHPALRDHKIAYVRSDRLAGTDIEVEPQLVEILAIDPNAGRDS